jgi:serine/threonine protein kinase
VCFPRGIWSRGDSVNKTPGEAYVLYDDQMKKGYVNQPPELDDADAYVAAVLSAVETLHAAHVSHNDLHPSNINNKSSTHVIVVDLDMALLWTDGMQQSSKKLLDALLACTDRHRMWSAFKDNSRLIDPPPRWQRFDSLAVEVLRFAVCTGRSGKDGGSARVAWTMMSGATGEPATLTAGVNDGFTRLLDMYLNSRSSCSNGNGNHAH